MEKLNRRTLQIAKEHKGFSLIEMLIVIALFLLIAGVGVGSYIQYYKASLSSAELDQVITLMRQTRALALKNPSGSDYGVHIDLPGQSFISFQGTYNPVNPDNKVISIDQLEINEINLLPDIGVTDEIIFANQTGKTQNAGTILLRGETFDYTIEVNDQGLIN